MVAELQHRTRNLIAVVMSIAGQTLRRAGSLEEFGERFEERLEGALARPGSPVTCRGAGGADRDAAAARARRAGRGACVGPGAARGARGAAGGRERADPSRWRSTNSATNARKHGALAVERGRLDVTWRVRERRRTGRGLRSSGSRAAWDPWRRRRRVGGYGRELIERALPYALGAATVFRAQPRWGALRHRAAA